MVVMVEETKRKQVTNIQFSFQSVSARGIDSQLGEE